MIYKLKPNRVARTYLGGHRIDALRGTKAEDGFFPEEWIASITTARNVGSTNPEEGLSVTLDGKSLLGILENNPELLGQYKSFPILLKLLDASERLVIQAHPTVEYAVKNLNSPYGKAECWYVISADPGAHVYLGFKEGVKREEWIGAFEKQDSEKMLSMLHKIELQPGDVWFVDGGVPHAIGGGCLLAELQEPTDLMVVPEGTTPSGRKIAEERMHCGLGFERMFEVFDYTGCSFDTLKSKFYRHSVITPNTKCPIIDASLTDKFQMDEYCVTGNYRVEASSSPSVAIILEGNACFTEDGCTHAAHPGDSFFLPATAGEIEIQGNVRFLLAKP